LFSLIFASAVTSAMLMWKIWISQN
jgi:hypothetical protein